MLYRAIGYFIRWRTLYEYHAAEMTTSKAIEAKIQRWFGLIFQIGIFICLLVVVVSRTSKSHTRVYFVIEKPLFHALSYVSAQSET